MAVIRELVTKLSFDVDKRGIENFNRSITGFKTKFALAATAATGFVAGIVKSVASVSDAILDTNELSRATGIATRELIGLQRAAGQFRISPTQFVSSLTRLNDLVRDAEFGFGKLFDIARQLEIEIRDDNGALLQTQVIFERIVGALGRIDNESLRIDIAKRLFGDGRFADVAAAGVDELNRLKEGFAPLGEEIEKSEGRARRFNRSLSRFTETGRELAFRVFPPLIDFLGKAFEGFNLLADSISNLGFQGLKNSLNKAGEAIGDFARKATFGLFGESVDTTVGRLQQEQAEFDRGLNQAIQNLSPAAKERFTTGNFNINTNVEIELPPGTEESQRQFMQSAAKEAFTESFNDRFEEILDNFPETE